MLTRATIAVRAGRPVTDPDAPLNVPPMLASTYVAGGSLEYGRFGNPTWEAFEDTLAQLEGPSRPKDDSSPIEDDAATDNTSRARAIAFASGAAAVNAVLSLAPADRIVVAPHDAYSGTLGLLSDFSRTAKIGGLELSDIADTEGVERSLASKRVGMLWIESPTNPGMSVADLPALCALGRAAGALVVVDNTFATPLLQRPLEVGADIVVHSASKYLSGHSDVLLGAAVTQNPELHARLSTIRAQTGAVPGPFETWLALRGIRTLHLRMASACANALELAHRLAGHPSVERVRYPGLASDPGHSRARAQLAAFGAIICIEVRVPPDDVVRRARLWTHATSLGGVESTLERRRRWASESPVIPENLLRLSVGIEDVEDLWGDLVYCLAPC